VAEYAEEIERYCRDHYEEMVSLLERIVNVDSASDNPAGVDELARVLQAELAMAGCETERVPPDASRVGPWVAAFFLPDLGGYDRVAPHLVGRWSGRGTGHALLVGHMDTAFAPGEAQRTPFRRDGDRATGCAIAGLRGSRFNTTYGASKAFQRSYLEGLRVRAHHLRLPITVTDICPGFVDTPMTKGQKGMFWLADAETAARQIAGAIGNKRRLAYITRRWAIIAWIIRHMPNWLLERI
jgi:NAD(P)-dependent dehydrogenase (short-subunit alcohol dehydrogenase family)